MPPITPASVRLPLPAPQAVTETSALLWTPDEDLGREGVVLAPGAGTTIAHATLSGIAEGLSARGFPVLAFNFGYAEAGRRAPDPMPRLLTAFAHAAGAARDLMGGRPVVLGGRSMGGRVASLLVAGGEPASGLLLLNYPLHRPGKGGERAAADLRSDHWPQIRVPVLFCVGDRDPMCDLDLLERERRARLNAAPSEVHVAVGADHSLRVRRRDPRSSDEVLSEVVDVAAGWLERLPVSAGGADRP
ncbi:MAG TPA: alpha/beta family hydrolase [Egibacteraceae bacterium]|nr:alpha/beta family hydrolase [Egibacteraceae bacterium]